MKRALPDGTVRKDEYWGYLFQKHEGRWVRQHRLIMEKRLGRKLHRSEVVHHKNGVRDDNRLKNLEVMGKRQHSRHHSLGRLWSPATKRKLSRAAKILAADPAEKKRRSLRAKRQHREGKFGYATTTPAGRERIRAASARNGKKNADRLRKMIAATPSAEMSRRSYCRKIFKRGDA